MENLCDCRKKIYKPRKLSLSLACKVVFLLAMYFIYTSTTMAAAPTKNPNKTFVDINAVSGDKSRKVDVTQSFHDTDLGDFIIIDANCSTQKNADGSDASADPIFSCDLDDAKVFLTIKFKPGKSGEGTVTISATDSGGNDATGTHKFVVRVLQPNPNDLSLTDDNGIAGCLGWKCSFYAGFFIGAEGTTVSDVDAKSTARVEFTSYQQINDLFHISGSLMSTNSEEQTATEGQDDITEAIKGDINLTALFGSKLDKGMRWGFIANNAIKQISGNEKFEKEYYGGVRFARDQLHYFDILYGKSEGIKGQRVEFRGQIHVNNNIVTGFSLNVGAKDIPEDSGDTVNLYVMTPIDLTGIFSSLGN